MRGGAKLPALLAVSAAVGLGGCAPRLFDETSGEKYARTLQPAVLEATPTRGGPVGTARVRVYVDDGYRSQNADASVKIRLLFERASRVLEPTTGLRFEVVDVQQWKDTPQRVELQSALDDLAALDPARDVDFVVGVVDALSHISTDLHQMGRANLLGRHAVVRGLADAVEVKALEQALRTVRERDRKDLYARRKRHKEEEILLHELGHLLGAPHVVGARDIMAPSYSHNQTGFSREMADLLRQVATARMAKSKDAAREGWKKALALMQGADAAHWNEDEKASILPMLQELAKGGDKAAAAGEALGSSIRPSDREKFRAAERLLVAGESAEAWEELESLIDFYPDEPAINRLACRLAASSARPRAEIEARCGRAAKADPDDGEPHLRLAQVYAAAGDKAQAATAARAGLAAIQKSAAAAPAKGPDAPDPAAVAAARSKVAGELATLFQQLGAVTWAEQAAAMSADPKVLSDWARRTRVRFAMPAGGPVAPEREAEYVAGVTKLLEDVYGRRYAEADKAAARLEKQFPRAAGIPAARCDLEIRRNRYAEARARCREALRRDSDSAWSHYLLGLLDKRDRKSAAAIGHLEKAISLDATLKHAYQTLAEIYGQAGRAADQKRVAAAYQKQFGAALP